MVRAASLACAVGLCVSGLAGCGQSDTEFRLRRAEAEQDRLRLALERTEAVAAALRFESESLREKSESAVAERDVLRHQLRDLERAQSELLTEITERAAAPPEPPQVAATPLPRELDEALREFAQMNEGLVEYDARRGAVTLAGDLLFSSGSADLAAAGEAPLRLLGRLAQRWLPPRWEVIAVGHTDAQPLAAGPILERHATNWHLSVHRAIAVKDALAAGGLSERRLGEMGFAASRPAADDPARNRRVEVFFVPPGGISGLAPSPPPRGAGG